MDDGIIFKASKDCIIKYQDKDVTAEFDSKSAPIISIGIPDVKVN